MRDLLQALSRKISTAISKYLILKEGLYMEKGASLICKDKIGNSNRSVELVASHIDRDADIQIDFPQFDIVKILGKDGVIGMHVKHALTLDTDDFPTQDSKKLLTSGTLYEILNNLQNQIDELKSDRK